jgi:hypothetical protein
VEVVMGVFFVLVVVAVAVAVSVAIVGVTVMIVLVVYVLNAWGYRYFGGRLRVQLPADQKHQSGSEERKQGYQPDVI